jgi:D-alanyl-D-alanine carboxypeptidase
LNSRILQSARVSCFALLAATLAVFAAKPAAAGPYLLLDAASGRVLAESDAGAPWYPASVTKLMTTYLAFQAMRQGKANPQTLITVSANAVAQPPSKMGFKAGTQLTLDNAIKMLMVRSANDIAVVVAEGLGGSVESFASDMNATAARLGMTGTHFVNPHGLPEENQVTTARDMAVLTLALIKEFPEYELYFRIPAIQLGKRVIRNHNRLIDRYPGAEGMKTGFICSSGFNMVASAKRGNKRMIAVVFGAYSAAQRSEDAARLMERGFRRDANVFTDSQFAMLDAIRNVSGKPHDMRDEMCNPKKRRPAAESDIDEDDEPEAEISANAKADPKAKGKAAKKTPRPSLLGDLKPSMPPIVVFTGPHLKMPETKIVATPAKEEKAEKAKRPGPAKTETGTARKAEKPATTAAKTEKPVPASAKKPAPEPKLQPNP